MGDGSKTGGRSKTISNTYTKVMVVLNSWPVDWTSMSSSSQAKINVSGLKDHAIATPMKPLRNNAITAERFENNELRDGSEFDASKTTGSNFTTNKYIRLIDNDNCI